MIYVLTCLSLVLITAAISVLIKVRFELAIPITVGLFVVTGYLFGLFHILSYAPLLLCAFAVIAAGICAYKLRSDKLDVRKVLLTPGALLYIFVLIVIFFVHLDSRFYVGDTMQHWGLAVKNMFYLQALATSPETTIAFFDYPPATALFQYFFVWRESTFCEASVMRGMSVMMLSYIIPVTAAFSVKHWKSQWKMFVIGLAACLALPLIFDMMAWSSTLLVDGILGLMTAYLLYVYFSEEPSRKTSVSIALVSVVMVLTKNVGLLLALIALTIIAVDFIRRHISIFSARETFMKSVAFLAPSFIAIFAARVSWSVYVSAQNLGGPMMDTDGLSLSSILAVITGHGQPYQYETILMFARQFLLMLNTDNGWPMPPVSYVLFIGALIFFSWLFIKNLCEDKQKTQIRYLTYALIVGFAIYAILHLVFYLAVFSPEEAVIVASMDRYLNTFALAAIACLLYLALHNAAHKWSEETNRWLQVICLTIIVLAGAHVALRVAVLPKPIFAQTQEVRTSTKRASVMSQYLDSTTDRVYVISLDAGRFDYWTIRTDLTPVHVSPWYVWGLQDVGEVTACEWATVLLAENYTHVYVHTINEEFLKEFSVLFENRNSIETDEMYQVIANENFRYGIMLRRGI